MYKFIENIFILFISSSFISKVFGHILEGEFVHKNILKCLLAL